MLDVHIVHIATYARTKLHAPSFNTFQIIKGSRFLADRRTDRLTDGRTYTGRGLIIYTWPFEYNMSHNYTSKLSL